MSETPRSNVFASRMSTPVNELDDHRFQPESLPRAEGHGRPSGRRGTANSMLPDSRPPLLQVNGESHDGILSRDFESAIVDEEDPGLAPSGTGNRRISSTNRGSISPGFATQGSLRRVGSTEHRRSSSRGSSSTRKSVSPPNSVEAFAEPRHRARAGTAGTMNSFAPDQVYPLDRSNSRNTFTRPRDFSHDETENGGDEKSSDQGSVEDDVCFPQSEEDYNVYSIDFEDLQDFVARDRDNTPVPHPVRRRLSFVENKVTPIGLSIPKAAEPVVCESVGTTSMWRRSGENCENPQGAGSESESDEKKLHSSSEPLEALNRWSFFSSELQESIHAPDLGALLLPGETFQHLFALGSDGGCWWLDMLMPSEEEVEVICKAFGIHGLTREDIIQQETREKVELFKSYYFVCFRSFFQVDKLSEDYLEPVNVYAVVFREGILTFTFCPSPHAGNVRKRMGRLRDYVSLGSDWICYALIDDIVDSFGPVIRSVEQETDSIEDMVFVARSEDSRQLLRQIGESRKKVMSLLRLLGGKADVIKGFAKRCNEQYSVAPRQDVGLYLSDIQDHVVTMASNLGHFDHVLSRSHANYLAQLSVDNISQGNKANQVLAKLTFLATILVPMNLICGLFGMNVQVPGKDAHGYGWFLGILGFMFLFALTAFIVARRCRML
ncbi:MAG: Mg(2+) transporter [Chrysothrix sp. TS-e1954]|nr:MAG: Mg(2+) transporter [Chrysothrix sp. TS-e1954]